MVDMGERGVIRVRVGWCEVGLGQKGGRVMGVLWELEVE